MWGTIVSIVIVVGGVVSSLFDAKGSFPKQVIIVLVGAFLIFQTVLNYVESEEKDRKIALIDSSRYESQLMHMDSIAAKSSKILYKTDSIYKGLDSVSRKMVENLNYQNQLTYQAQKLNEKQETTLAKVDNIINPAFPFLIRFSVTYKLHISTQKFLLSYSDHTRNEIDRLIYYTLLIHTKKIPLPPGSSIQGGAPFNSDLITEDFSYPTTYIQVDKDTMANWSGLTGFEVYNKPRVPNKTYMAEISMRDQYTQRMEAQVYESRFSEYYSPAYVSGSLIYKVYRDPLNASGTYIYKDVKQKSLKPIYRDPFILYYAVNPETGELHIGIDFSLEVKENYQNNSSIKGVKDLSNKVINVDFMPDIPIQGDLLGGLGGQVSKYAYICFGENFSYKKKVRLQYSEIYLSLFLPQLQ